MWYWANCLEGASCPVLQYLFHLQKITKMENVWISLQYKNCYAERHLLTITAVESIMLGIRASKQLLMVGCEGTGGFPSQRASDVELVCFFVYSPNKLLRTPPSLDAMTRTCHFCWALQTNYFDPTPGIPKNTTQHQDVSFQSTLDRRPMYYSQNGPVESECNLNNVNSHIIRNQYQIQNK